MVCIGSRILHLLVHIRINMHHLIQQGYRYVKRRMMMHERAIYTSKWLKICLEDLRLNYYIGLMSTSKSMISKYKASDNVYNRNLDSFIGRTAHIQFLECQPLMKMMVYRYREFFS